MQPSVSFVDGGQVEWRNRHGVYNEAETKTHLTYSRGVLGLGANVLDTRFLLLDSLAYRSIASFTPGEITPEQFAERGPAADVDHVPRTSAGYCEAEGQDGRFVPAQCRAGADPGHRQSPAVLEASHLPPVVAAGQDLNQLVDQARRWLKADRRGWPAADPERKNPKKSGRKPKSPESVMAETKAAMAEGISWRDVRQNRKPSRHLAPRRWSRSSGNSSDNCL